MEIVSARGFDEDRTEKFLNQLVMRIEDPVRQIAQEAAKSAVEDAVVRVQGEMNKRRNSSSTRMGNKKRQK